MFLILLAVVLAGSACAQSADTRAAFAADAGSTAPAIVRAGDPVLTIHGLCSAARNIKPEGEENCSTVMTREDFDELMKVAASRAASNAETRQSVAKSYIDLVGLAEGARKLGIEESAQFRQTMELLRLRTLADMYRKTLEAEAKIVSDGAVDAYYQEHIPQFEEVKLRRVVIPKTNLAMTDRAEYEKKALQVAGEMRDRAAKGEDLDQLQKDAYTALGFSSIPPSTDVGNRRRASLIPEVAQDVFSLAAGAVSKVENETYSLVIYKVETKVTLPKQRVKDDIIREIAKQKVEAGLKAAREGIRPELNEKYFGTTAPPQ